MSPLPAADVAPRTDRMVVVALAVALAVNLGVYLALGHAPYQDTANHAARYALIARAWRGTPVGWLDVVPVPAPYFGLDAVGAALALVVGPTTAVRVIGAVGVCALPLGMALLLGRVAPAQRAWALVGALLSLSFFLLNGMVNYHLGVGALLAWLAVWWPRRARATARGRAALAAGIVGLYMLHLAAVAAALAIIGLDLLLAVWRDARVGAHEEGASREGASGGGAAASLPARVWRAVRAERGRVLTVAWCAGIVALLLGALFAVLPPTHDPPTAGGGAPVWRTPRSKAWAPTLLFYTLTPWELLATAPAYAAAFVAWARLNRRRAWTPNALAGGVVLLGALFLATPLGTAGGAGLLDVRWMVPAMLLVFAAAPADAADAARRPPRWVVAVLLAAVVARAALVWHVGQRVERELADYDAVLDRLPADARLLGLVAGPVRYPRLEPFLHYALVHTARTGARAAGLFSYHAAIAGRPPVTYFHLGHVRERGGGYALDEPWFALGRPTPPWDEVRREYDYVVVAGAPDPAAESMLRAAGARVAVRQGEVAAWQVGGGPANVVR